MVQFYAAADDAHRTHILMQFCDGGDLRAAIRAGAFAPERRLRDGLARPLLRALAALAARGVTHRDVKPENVFVAGGEVLLGDFGLAVAAAAASDGGGDDSGSGGSGGGGSPASSVECARGSGGCAAAAAPVVVVAASASSGSDADDSSCFCEGGGSGSGSGSGNGDSGSGNGGALSASASGSMASFGLARPPAAPGLSRGRSASFAALAALGAAAPQAHAAGTAAYTAPEVLMAALTDGSVPRATGPKNDVFALGLVALECLTGRHPFVSCDASPGAIVCSALSGDPVPLPAAAAAAAAEDGGDSSGGSDGGDGAGALRPPPPSRACLDWLRRALEKDPSKRATAEELLAHEWMTLELPVGGDDADAARAVAAAAAAAAAASVGGWGADECGSGGAAGPCGRLQWCGSGGSGSGGLRSGGWLSPGSPSASPAPGRFGSSLLAGKPGLSPLAGCAAPGDCGPGAGGSPRFGGGGAVSPMSDAFGGSALLRRAISTRGPPGGCGGGGYGGWESPTAAAAHHGGGGLMAWQAGASGLGGGGPGALRSASARWEQPGSPARAGAVGARERWRACGFEY